MKSIRISLSCLMMAACLSASAAVTFKFSSRSISEGPLKTRMESNVSALLTELDRAGRAGTSLNLSGINMESEAKTRLQNFWEDSRLTCNESMVIKRCLEDQQGYQIRGIQIMLKPTDASSYTQGKNRELTISLNRSGVITGVRPALEKLEDVEKIMGESKGVADTYMRREILKWVEDFRCYYNEKNINALNQIFSEDALIITGSVTQSQKKGPSDGVTFDRGGMIKYKVQNKQQYISNLRRVFANNAKIDVRFDHIEVAKHSAKDDIYGVKLHQIYNSSKYSDDGWLFLLWDFTDRDHPQIHVRTWQPLDAVNQDGVFNLDDFFIP